MLNYNLILSTNLLLAMHTFPVLTVKNMFMAVSYYVVASYLQHAQGCIPNTYINTITYIAISVPKVSLFLIKIHKIVYRKGSCIHQQIQLVITAHILACCCSPLSPCFVKK